MRLSRPYETTWEDWLLGGGAPSLTNDVWSSANGTNWTLVTSNAAWSSRTSQRAVAFNGKMWMLGGTTSIAGPTNDVWSSPDGLNWTLATSAAPWGPRYAHMTAVFGGKLWVLGGTTGGTNWLNDVWSSPDGLSWTQVTNAAPWSPRYGIAAGVFNNRLWLTGGQGSNFVNDVWYDALDGPAMMGSYFLFQKQ